jgi:hypothetical protein
MNITLKFSDIDEDERFADYVCAARDSERALLESDETGERIETEKYLDLEMVHAEIRRQIGIETALESRSHRLERKDGHGR